MLGKITGVLALTIATSLTSYASDWGYQRYPDERGYQRRYNEQRRYRPREDYRHTFAYSGGSFSQQRDGTWVERNRTGEYYFREVNRTPEHIELYDDDRGAGALLGMNAAYYDDNGQWRLLYRGRWR
jgi:hypothetical protein